MKGKIVKALADFYYVYCEGKAYQCKAKGLFRKEKVVPLVGDLVDFSLTNAKDIEGNITEILPRKNSLSRPNVANIDVVLLVFSVKNPKPNIYLLDRFLSIMERNGLETIIVFNKTDLDSDFIGESYKKAYGEIGYKCILCSLSEEGGLNQIKTVISGKTVSVAGPSGVGKSTLINRLTGKDIMETGDISKKNLRGKQTTRHTELVPISEDTFIVDTPGFSSTDITGVGLDFLSESFLEFKKPMTECRFSGCSHTHEPDCKVKEALESGDIMQSRYDSYVKMYEELKNLKHY